MFTQETLDKARDILARAESALGTDLGGGSRVDLLLDNLPDLRSTADAHAVLDALDDMPEQCSGNGNVLCMTCGAVAIHRCACPADYMRRCACEFARVELFADDDAQARRDADADRRDRNGRERDY